MSGYCKKLSFYFILSLSACAVHAQDVVHIASLTFEGNRITKQKILLREMTFREGQQIPANELSYQLERSRSNIWNLTLFNFVEIDTCHSSPVEIEVIVRVVERWYVWPVPIVEFADRNFSEWWQTKRFDRLDYGSYIFWHNFRGMNEEVVMEFRFGFNNRYQIRYEFPFIDKEQKWGIELKGGFEQNREVSYASVKNKRIFYKDPERHIKKSSYGSVIPSWRPSLYDVHTLEVSFTHSWVADSVIALQPEYFGSEQPESNYFTLKYELKRDLTDYNIYPLSGYLLDVIIEKDGLHILDSPIDILSLEVGFSKFWKLHNRWYLATGAKIKLSSTNQQPYALQQGLGYKYDFVRGYELYVIDGQQFGLLKTSVRWAILPMRKIHLKFLKTEKFSVLPLAFYANFNIDMGYVIDRQFNQGNELAGTWLIGGGLGIDMVTFYDIVWRAEYSMNKNLEHGFFLHFTKHI